MNTECVVTDVNNMKKYKERLMNSGIVGLLMSGILTSGFCIYTALVFHEGYHISHKMIFTICGIILIIFLGNKVYRTYIKMTNKLVVFQDIVREFAITVFCSALWMIPFWMVWAWIIAYFEK